ncbi:MAG: HprK-related kinase B, partial [gamma proteobacterium symbiont of Ctena orbiculata]
PDRIDTSTPVPLEALVILNWNRHDPSPVRLAKIAIAQRGELLSAVMKSPGPFYQDGLGDFLRDDEPLQPAPYLALLKSVPVYEVTGRMDFNELSGLCLEQWGS